MKKIIALALALLMVAAMPLALASCNKDPEQDPDKTYTVGIIQLIEHVALDAATKGFKDALVAELGEGKVTFIEQNAQGQSETCTTIAGDLVSKKVDLILGNATAALQAAYNATETIPVLGTSITDYASALGLDNYAGGAVGCNVSGTTDLAPLDQQAAMIKELFPNATKVGLIYCSAEPNSKYQVNVVREELVKLGYADADIKDFPFADSNDHSSVSQAAAAYADVLYVPTDNAVANAPELVKNNIGNDPLVAGEAGICAGCGVATLSIDYYELGKITGKMAAKILKGEAKVGEMAVESVPAATITKKYNPVRWEELQLGEAPEGYTALS
ncbi:MAG: ABC transporter substrate-binding protein [Clostridia bacterium]|nr:ABC transporter substrate-binding protein [Clostridia bacterium]